jgi:general secretion pathway protein D
MRFLLALLLTVAITASAATPSPADSKAAQKAYKQGSKLQKQNRQDEAFKKFSEAAELDSTNPEYTTAREVVRQQLVYKHLQAGNEALLRQDRMRALAEFHAASELDPANQFALERLRDVFSEPASPPDPMMQVVEKSEEIELRPNPGQQNFRFTGDTRGLLELVARTFGLTAVFDETFSSRPVRFNVDGLDFRTAMPLASRFAKAMWTPLSEKQIFFAQDTAENRRQFEHMSLRTFYLPDISTPQEMNEIVSVFRGLFEVRHIVPNAAKSTLTVRAPKATLDVAAAWLSRLASGRPQVMLDVRAYQVSQNMLRNIGVQLPLQFQMFNIPAAALQLTQNPDLQTLINQLISSGAINQANTQAISALLAQLQAQQSNPLLSQSFFAFGGGLTLFGVNVPPVSLNFSFNESHVTNLEHMTLRASEGNAATFRVGSRFPILNGTFSPLINTPGINNLLTDQSFIAPFPSFSYEDLGITLKATPQVHEGTRPEVTLNLEFEIRLLTGTALNGVPVISNREFNGVVRLREGEPAGVVGMISRNEQQSISGLPGLGHLPLLKRAVTNESKNFDEDEILLVITPHIVRLPEHSSPNEIWLPASL